MNPNVSYNTSVEITNQSALVNATNVLGQDFVPQNSNFSSPQNSPIVEMHEMATMLGLLKSDILSLMASRERQEDLSVRH